MGMNGVILTRTTATLCLLLNEASNRAICLRILFGNDYRPLETTRGGVISTTVSASVCASVQRVVRCDPSTKRNASPRCRSVPVAASWGIKPCMIQSLEKPLPPPPPLLGAAE